MKLSVMELQKTMTSHDPIDPSMIQADGICPGISVGQQIPLALKEKETLAYRLMEKVCEPRNLNRALKRVKANKGAPGCDGMTVRELSKHFKQNRNNLVWSLLEGTYRPQPVRGITIPKPNGGERQLGIPTVVDRLVQQAIHQVLEPILDPNFSESSFGFRPGRSAHGALKQAQEIVRGGRRWVVDIDIEAYFDNVNHDILVSRLARRIGDKRLLKLIRRFLQAGLMQDGICHQRVKGTPQGGPLSPILSNLMLDDLDKELEKRGHLFCRYADDCNIYVHSERAGERVLTSVRDFLRKHLRLEINPMKSAVALVSERQFLGYKFNEKCELGISKKSMKRVKERIRGLTRRNRGINIGEMIRDLNRYLRGWMSYYRLVDRPSWFEGLDGWIRRRLRCFRIKQCRTWLNVAKEYGQLSYKELHRILRAHREGGGLWYKSNTYVAKWIFSVSWFNSQGLQSLKLRYEELTA